MQRHLTNFLLGQHHPIGASVWMHSRYRCYAVKSKRLDVSLALHTKQPPPTPGFSSPRLGMVCKLKKAIYVTAPDKLKQAPRAKKGPAVRILPCLFADVTVAWQPICLFHPPHYFLGMEVSRSTSGLPLTQTRQAALTTDALPRAFVLGRNLISWSAKKQPLTLTSKQVNYLSEENMIFCLKKMVRSIIVKGGVSRERVVVKDSNDFSRLPGH
ncbi:unnamed protein product [Prunus armeniaca]|uniref:Reverse transcriptase Ty1/copia-type domain-containing protein n=1 Tax=Prunus armeniaca TaxID=36596 RepID=A0A6J5U7I3_PRUAR|nr:unnamed protein product [Prunus armeniaca]CAB4302804.1 unnamed protein product [Prunus armeniaca]